jgi:Domain of unknown function (DUF4279)
LEENIEKYALTYEVTPSTLVYFALQGEHLQPAKISELLGTQPHKAWAKGDRRRGKNKDGTPATYTFGLWEIVPDCSPYEDFDTQLDLLLTKMEKLPPIIHDLINEYGAGLAVRYSSGEWNFGFHFDQEILERLSKFKVSIDIDIYTVSDDEEEK